MQMNGFQRIADIPPGDPARKLKSALATAEAGFPVFPIAPNTKVPMTKNGFKAATTSAERIERFWKKHLNANIGIATGEPSGLAVTDVDVKNGAKGRESLSSIKGMTPTLTVRTPTGGFHLYYKTPGPLRSRIGLLPGIDLKVDAGYVLGPGSDIDGKLYEIVDPSVAIEDLPAPILDLARKQNGTKPSYVGSAIPEGKRNKTLTSLAGTMRRRGMGTEAILAALKVMNAAQCAPPMSEKVVAAIAASVSRYPPRNRAKPADSSTSDEDAVLLDFTDDALGLEFTLKHAEDWCYVASWGHWLHWDGVRWLKETTLRAFDLARRICRGAAARCEKPKIAAKVASATTVAAVERLARSDRRHAATTEQWDANCRLLGTPGGSVDLKTGEVRPNLREDYMTKLTLARPGAPGVLPQLWLSFLNDVTDGDKELQAYLARLAGYALTGITSEHALFFLYGTGANGKSVFLNTLAAILGDYATNAPMETFLECRGERHPTDLAGLRGARLVTSIEVEKGRRWAEAKIKSMTGGDKICARFMRQDFFEYKPQFKLIIAGNNKPAIRDVDEAMKRRLHLIPFTITIPKERRNQALPEQLLEEKDTILRWAIDGCLEWQRIGLNPPARVVSATEEYLDAEDAMGRWIDDECRLHPSAHAATNELFTSWKAWAERWGEYVGTMRKFSDDLGKRGLARWKSGNTKGFKGITLKGTEVQEDMV